MAGLYVVPGHADERRLDRIESRMRLGQEATVRESSGLAFAWVAHDDVARYGPAKDPTSGVICVAGGRTTWPVSEWQRAARLPFSGGLANRLLLERYLAKGPGTVAPYNGAAAVVIWDPRERTAHLWTDQFGYHPAFLYTKGGRAIAFTTFPDLIASDDAIDARPDLASMAEFLRAWRTTPPYTYYEGLVHVGAATHVRWDVATGATWRSSYWEPFRTAMFPSLEEGAEELAFALRAAVGERTAAADRTALFVSGGADSRVMLFATAAPERTWGVNLYEYPTLESEISRQLCERSGVTYVGIARDSDYYPRMLAENVRWSGAMWSIEDSHYLGVRDDLCRMNPDLVMTACTTDWIFKGYGLERSYRRFLGRNLPIRRLEGRRVNGFLPNLPRDAPPEFREQVETRLSSWLAGTPTKLRDDADFLAVEERRIRPACYTVSVSGQMMYRIFPYDTFLADSRVAACYSRTPAKWKLNGQMWGLAAGRICARARDVEDANYGWQVDAGATDKLMAFAKGWLRRRVSTTDSPRPPDDHPPSPASWPDMGWYAVHSKRLREFWDGVARRDRQMMTRLWGSNPWDEPLERWASRGNDLTRIVTLLQHWQLNPSLKS